MDPGTLTTVVSAIGGAVISGLLVAVRAGRARESIERDISAIRSECNINTERIAGHADRLGAFDVWRAATDERWAHVREVLDEIRSDVKSLKEQR